MLLSFRRTVSYTGCFFPPQCKDFDSIAPAELQRKARWTPFPEKDLTNFVNFESTCMIPDPQFDMGVCCWPRTASQSRLSFSSCLTDAETIQLQLKVKSLDVVSFLSHLARMESVSFHP